MDNDIRVMLVGMAGWREVIRARCRETSFEEAEDLSAPPPGSIGLIVVQHSGLLKSYPWSGFSSQRRVHVLSCEPSAVDLPEGVVDIDLNKLNDETITLYLNSFQPLNPAVIPEQFLKEIDERTDFYADLIDVAANLVASWETTTSKETNVPGRFDGPSFAYHLSHLGQTLRHHVNVQKRKDAGAGSERPTTELKTCFYLCEKTIILARGRQGLEQPRFGSAMESVGLVGGDEVHCEDGLLIALFIVIMDSAPPHSVPLPVRFGITNTQVEIQFDFGLARPQGVDIADSPEFLERFQKHLPTILNRFGASIDIAPSRVTLTLSRLTTERAKHE